MGSRRLARWFLQRFLPATWDAIDVNRREQGRDEGEEAHSSVGKIQTGVDDLDGMELDLVHILDETDVRNVDVSLIGEHLDGPDDANVGIHPAAARQ